jgi:hypothetical protein
MRDDHRKQYIKHGHQGMKPKLRHAGPFDRCCLRARKPGLSALAIDDTTRCKAGYHIEARVNTRFRVLEGYGRGNEAAITGSQ